MKQFIKKNKFIILVIVFAIIKQILVSNIPITAYPNQAYDDGMMVQMATSIRHGYWLGDYSSNILVKGPVFPFIVALINYIGLPYISVMSFIYTLSCIFFIFTIKDLFKTKKSLFVVYLILLFNPVSYAHWTLQRVYRNGITLAQVLIIFGSFYAMYINKDNTKKSLIYSIIGGITLSTLWLTREDGIWILPFIIVVILIILITNILKNKTDFFSIKKKRINIKNILSKIVIPIIPMIILVSSLNIMRLINYKVYGVYEYNEINDGYFGKVIKSIYSVKTDEDIRWVTATRNKLDKICENSETLNSIKPQLDKWMDAWDYNDRTPGDGQVEDGWFWWALKQSVEDAGYYTDAKTSNEFYEKVYNEIQLAIKEKRLETQFSMPSNLMSPWKMSYFKELPIEMIKTTYFVLNFNDVKTTYEPSQNDTGDGIREFEAITSNLAIRSSQNNHEDPAVQYVKKYVKRLNNVGTIYKATGLPLAIIAFICYIIITIKLIKQKDKTQILNIWLLLTGVGCSLIVLIGGVSYNHITSCFSRYYMYLSGAYPLVSILTAVPICYVIENIKFRRKR